MEKFFAGWSSACFLPPNRTGGLQPLWEALTPTYLPPWGLVVRGHIRLVGLLKTQPLWRRGAVKRLRASTGTAGWSGTTATAQQLPRAADSRPGSCQAAADEADAEVMK